MWPLGLLGTRLMFLLLPIKVAHRSNVNLFVNKTITWQKPLWPELDDDHQWVLLYARGVSNITAFFI